MSRIFLTNLIVQKLELPGECFEKMHELKIKFQFFGKFKPVLTCDRINVNNLPRCPIGEFKTDPECLKERWGQEGIPLSVVYGRKKKKDNVLACGCIKLSENMLNKISESYDPVRHTANVELLSDNRIVGLATVKFELLQTCAPETGKKKGKQCDSDSDVMDYCDRLMSEEDVFFVVDDDDDDSNVCPPSINGRTPGGNDRDGQSNGDPQQEQPAFSKMPPYCECDVNPLCPILSEPELIQTHYRNRRRCPLCKEDVSWLPKLAACVHCGYKPVPEPTEKVYTEKVSAGQLLMDHLNMPQSDVLSELSFRDVPPSNDPVKSSDDFGKLIEDFKFLKDTIKRTQQANEQANGNGEPKNEEKDEGQNLASIFNELRSIFVAKEDEMCPQSSKVLRSGRKSVNSTKGGKDKKKNGNADKADDDQKAGKSNQNDQNDQNDQSKRKSKAKPQIKSKVYSSLTVRKKSITRLGHKTCLVGVPTGRKAVPGNMGWLWTKSTMSSLPGWRPGAIRRSIRELMAYFLNDFPIDSIPVSKYMSYLKAKCPKPDYIDQEEKPENLEQLPTLHVLKKDDEYIITLRPLKDAESLKHSANPYANMKPVQFRITKNPLQKEMRDMKRSLKQMGFSKCICHLPIKDCYCRSFIDKERLDQEVEKQCKERHLENCDEMVLSDTSESDNEFDFSVTPPAGLVHPERMQKRDLIHCETQYDENDWAVPSLYPLPPNALVQYGGCAMGERKERFKWIFGKGKINQAPEKPPPMRNVKKDKKKKRAKGGYCSDVNMLPGGANYTGPYGGKGYNIDDMAIDDSGYPYATNLSEPRMKRLAIASVPPSNRLTGGQCGAKPKCNMRRVLTTLRSPTTRYGFGATIPPHPRERQAVCEPYFEEKEVERKPFDHVPPLSHRRNTNVDANKRNGLNNLSAAPKPATSIRRAHVF